MEEVLVKSNSHPEASQAMEWRVQSAEAVTRAPERPALNGFFCLLKKKKFKLT